MKIISASTLKASVVSMALATLLIGCATPQQGPMFDSTSKAIRAAQTAGALEHAPDEYRKANEIYRKAQAMQQHRRTERAQKLLELASAQASLAKAISDASEAEASLGYLYTDSTR